jgi:hypothetical protein
MKMLCQTIEDLKTIQNKYPDNSRGFEALRFAIIILEREIELKEVVNPHWVSGEPAASYIGDNNAGQG